MDIETMQSRLRCLACCLFDCDEAYSRWRPSWGSSCPRSEVCRLIAEYKLLRTRESQLRREWNQIVRRLSMIEHELPDKDAFSGELT